jgi:hypothetical protein
MTCGSRSTLEASNQGVMMSIIQTDILNGAIKYFPGLISKAFDFIYRIAKDKVAMN